MGITILVSLIIHLIFVAILVTYLLPHFNEDRFLITLVIFLLPVLNLIMGVMILGGKLNNSKSAIDSYEHKLGHLNDEIYHIKSQWKDKYESLEKFKFRRVRIGDIFVVPNEKDWSERARGKKLIVSEIHNTHLVCHLENHKGQRWDVNWEYLKNMVFLSQEPFKPFEFIKDETNRTS